MYRIYLRNQLQQVSDKTTTGDPNAARAAFESLVNRTDLDDMHMLAVLNCDGRPVAHHDFRRRPDGSPLYTDKYWRGRCDQIDFTRAA